MYGVTKIIKYQEKTNSEIRDILDELGFTGTKKCQHQILLPLRLNQKLLKKKVENNDIVKQIKELNDMFKSGVISKEEFDKTKKILE